MKRIVLFVIGILFLLPVSIAGTDEAVTLVSYEQGWLDDNGTIALKNNTDKDIFNVSFRLTYLDMNGRALNYDEFTKSVNIAPGMTKKVDVPAYENERHYHYYKSENMPGGSPSFKIEYKLLDYNKEDVADEDEDPYSEFSNYEYKTHNSSYDWFWLFAIIAALAGISITVGLYVLVAVMAQQRHRNVVVWILLSMICSPLLMIIILLCIGDSQRDQL